MAEQTFRSPGFYEREIDLSQRQQAPVGTPAGVIGTANKGPAFVPVTVGSIADFITKFGDLDADKFGPYAVNEFLKNRTALTYLRVLGGGANNLEEDISKTIATGQVLNAGFIVTGSITEVGGTDGRHRGCIQFLTAIHDATANEAVGMPLLTDNDSITDPDAASLIRASVMMASDARLMVLNGDEALLPAMFNGVTPADDVATLSGGFFKLIVSSSAGPTWSNDDNLPGIKVYTASLDPTSANYVGSILNTNSTLFSIHKHFLYTDFAVDDQVAAVATSAGAVGVASGSANTSAASGDTAMIFRDAFGHYDTRYTTPRTSWFISQPYGTIEYDLFYAETLSDGEYGNNKYKISITNVKASTNPSNDYGTFSLQVRAFADSDTLPQVLEQFDLLTLDPTDDKYIVRIIGDKSVKFDFDATTKSERRLVVKGKYPNMSRYIRIVMNEDVVKRRTPGDAMPFGFGGVEILKTSDNNTDFNNAILPGRLGIISSAPPTNLSGSIVPPLPFRFKVTRGDVNSPTPGFAGEAGNLEVVNTDLYWGVKHERNTDPLNSNVTAEKNPLVETYTKFTDIKKLDTLLTGSDADVFNNNKFTLARVALPNTAVSDLTGSAREHMLDTAYIRNGKPDSTNYTVSDGVITNRITLGTLIALTSSIDFNRFVAFNKFTNIMVGGFDGINILDPNAQKMNDQASSIETKGGASAAFTSPGLAENVGGTGQDNNTIASYRSAIDIMTEKYYVNTNILAIPGIRDTFVTDYAMEKTKGYKFAFYVMDLPPYDDNSVRIFDDTVTRPSVDKTINALEARVVDNNYAATYFPDVSIDDELNNRRVNVPSSVAVMAALGFNDRVSYPWFAPAGFNRAALDFVKNVDVRLTSGDRDELYDARINPIASFPQTGFVIFGQKTLQQARSALDRVNVRRLMNELKRIVSNIATSLVFEQNTLTTRQIFINNTILQLGLIQANAGIESFNVVMDSSNNTQDDIENNRLNGRIVVVPTRAVEFIAIDFIITTSGVDFT